MEFNEDISDITEVEIANHSVVLRNINEKLPRKWL